MKTRAKRNKIKIFHNNYYSNPFLKKLLANTLLKFHPTVKKHVSWILMQIFPMS